MEAYEACHDPFLRYCSALAYGKLEVDDLVQDTLLSAYQNFDRIRKKGQLLHYLIRTARNRSISHWRKHKNRTELLEKHAETLIAKGLSPEILADIQLLYSTMNRLPTKQRNAVILFEISGFSMKEIAQIQGSTEGAIKTKISRGRHKLRKLLEEGPQPVSSSINELFKTAQTITL